MKNEKYLAYTHRSIEKIFEEFKTSLHGLSDQQVKDYLHLYGPIRPHA